MAASARALAAKMPHWITQSFASSPAPSSIAAVSRYPLPRHRGASGSSLSTIIACHVPVVRDLLGNAWRPRRGAGREGGKGEGEGLLFQCCAGERCF
jgi:hypothetical protein